MKSTQKLNKIILYILWLNLPLLASGQVPNYVPTSNIQGYWPIEGSGADATLHNYLTGYNVNYTANRHNKNNSAVKFNYKNSLFAMSYASSFDLSKYNGLTISFWFYVGDTASYEQKIFQIRSYYGGDLEIKVKAGKNYQLSFLNSDKYNTKFNLTLDSVLEKNKWYHSAITVNPNSQIFKWYLNGDMVQSSGYSSFNWPAYNTLTFGNDNSSNMPFKGILDDVGLWSRELNDKEVLSLFAEKSCNLSITGSNRVSAIKGGNAQLWVSCSDTSAKAQWEVLDSISGSFVALQNNGLYSGVTDSVLVISKVDNYMDAKIFRCKLTSGKCFEYSPTMRLHCLCITNKLAQNSQIQLGDSTYFEVGAADPNATYRWQESSNVPANFFNNIDDNDMYSGTKTNTLYIRNTPRGNNKHSYRCIISSAANSCIDTSNNVLLLVNCGNHINIQPQNYFAAIGDEANMYLSTKASNTTYQWQLDNGTGFVDITSPSVKYIGTLSENLIIHSVFLSEDKNKYRCKVSNDDCQSLSDVAVLYVTWPVAVKPLPELNKINIWPNPSSDILYIQSSNEFVNENYIITDVSGKTILSGKIYNVEAPIKISDLPPGIYILKIKEYTFKIFKS